MKTKILVLEDDEGLYKDITNRLEKELGPLVEVYPKFDRKGKTLDSHSVLMKTLEKGKYEEIITHYPDIDIFVIDNRIFSSSNAGGAFRAYLREQSYLDYKLIFMSGTAKNALDITDWDESNESYVGKTSDYIDAHVLDEVVKFMNQVSESEEQKAISGLDEQEESTAPQVDSESSILVPDIPEQVKNESELQGKNVNSGGDEVSLDELDAEASKNNNQVAKGSQQSPPAPGVPNMATQQLVTNMPKVVLVNTFTLKERVHFLKELLFSHFEKILDFSIIAMFYILMFFATIFALVEITAAFSHTGVFEKVFSAKQDTVKVRQVVGKQQDTGHVVRADTLQTDLKVSKKEENTQGHGSEAQLSASDSQTLKTAEHIYLYLLPIFILFGFYIYYISNIRRHLRRNTVGQIDHGMSTKAMRMTKVLFISSMISFVLIKVIEELFSPKASLITLYGSGVLILILIGYFIFLEKVSENDEHGPKH